MANNLTSPGALPYTTGSYVGNSADNKAVTHNLTRIPNRVIIYCIGDSAYNYIADVGYNTCVNTRVTYIQTAPTATYFYVGLAANYGDSANFTGRTYFWIAF